MKTIKKETITPVFLDGYVPPIEEMKEKHVYISLQYNSAQHKCLCGCGEIVNMPLGHKNNGWNLVYNNLKTVISFAPSIGNFQIPCKSHYIITNNVANFV